MFIRKYQSSDGKELAELFYNTVHTVNAKDYTKEQLDAWATGQVDLEKWNQSLQEHFISFRAQKEVNSTMFCWLLFILKQIILSYASALFLFLVLEIDINYN